MRSTHAFGTFGLILHPPTPSFFRFRRMSVPPGNLLWNDRSMACSTPTSVFLVALVRMFFATPYSSESTPMPHLPSAEAFFSAPSPQSPPPWKITSAREPISFCATDAHLPSSVKLFEYCVIVFVPGTALLAQYW